MKKLFLSIFLLFAVVGFAQSNTTYTKYEVKDGGKLVSWYNPFTLATAATVYSDAIDVIGEYPYLPQDTTKFTPIMWSSSDSAIATISIEGRKVQGGQTSAWTALGTVITSYYGVGADSLNTRLLALAGTFATTVGSGKVISLAGFFPDQIRVKVAYASKTTVGNGGNFKVWLWLKEQK